MSRAKVWFLGGGPSAPDLLTVRALREIAEADIVIWGRPVGEGRGRHELESPLGESATKRPPAP
jgi:precorrin-2 methylase